MKLPYTRILITGASGSLGKQLLYELGQHDIRPIAHVRESSDTAYIDSLGLEKRVADLRNSEQIARLVQDVDAIIHTAAWVNFRQDRLTQFTGINTMGAVNLYQAAGTAGVKRFIHVSTVAAVGAVPRKPEENGHRPDLSEFVNESSQFNLGRLRIPYIMTKHAADVELQKLISGCPTELVTVHPSIVVAPSRSGDDRQKAMKHFSRFIVPDFRNILNLVDIRDVVPGILSALEKGRPGEKYILAGDNITARELALACSVYLGKIPHLVRIPRRILRQVARLGRMFQIMSGKGKVSIYPDLIRMLDYDWAYSSMKARDELGYNCRSIHVTLEDLLTNRFSGTWLKPTVD